MAMQLMEGALYEASIDFAMAFFDTTYLLIPEHGLILPEGFCYPFSLTLLDLGPAQTFAWARDIVASLLTLHPLTHLSIHIFASRLYAWPIDYYLQKEKLPYWDWNEPIAGLSYEERLCWFDVERYPYD